jgi:hypothetical protein
MADRRPAPSAAMMGVPLRPDQVAADFPPVVQAPRHPPQSTNWTNSSRLYRAEETVKAIGGTIRTGRPQARSGREGAPPSQSVGPPEACVGWFGSYARRYRFDIMAGRGSGKDPSRRTARGAATCERIVATTADLMHRQGVAATTLDQVVDTSGISKSQLYHYFPDKDALVAEVIAA